MPKVEELLEVSRVRILDQLKIKEEMETQLDELRAWRDNANIELDKAISEFNEVVRTIGRDDLLV